MFGIEEDFKQLMEQVYGPLDGGEMTEIEKVKAEIKVLEKKLSFLEELEQTKSPAEEAYKKVFGYYPMTDVGDASWEYFQNGYEQAQKEYQTLAEETAQETIPEEEETKTLYQILRELDKPMLIDDVCSAVKRWIFQYDCDYDTCKEYLEGYIECQTVLEERLK